MIPYPALRLARPVTLWAVHFIALYALISAACAPRQLLETDLMRVVAALVTLAAALVVLWWLLAGMRALRASGEDSPSRPMLVAVCWTAGISLLAILANIWPIAALGSCTG